MNAFEKQNLNLGRMVSWSKSEYLKKNPTHETIFNANVFSKIGGKLWYGDLDLTLDSEKLQEISNQIIDKLYVLREHDGRFENENITSEEAEEKAVKIFNPITYEEHKS